MQTSTQATTQLLNLLTLLETQQTLEALDNYKAFCYQLYLLASCDNRGQVQNATYGNNVRTTIGYDDAGYVGNIYTGRYGSSSRKDVQNFAYTYDRLGNVLTRNDDSISGKSIKDSYEYDTMNRLTRSISNVGTSTSRTTYRYNSIGNMTYASDNDGSSFLEWDSIDHIQR